jgi:ADP-heptose:LPS heptosyltransferase
MIDQWFLQHERYGLGNFVMATPCLKILSKQRSEPVPVFFSNDGIATLYKKSDFIDIRDTQPDGVPFGETCAPGNRKVPDIVAYCRSLAGDERPLEQLPPTYVDQPSESVIPGKVAVFHGCAGKHLVKKKDLGSDMRRQFIDSLKARDYTPVILGNRGDIDNYWRYNADDLEECDVYLDVLTLEETVAKLAQCQFFLSNDTGLYHVAGALEKPGLVIWKDTNRTKNKSPFDGIEHRSVYDETLLANIDQYIDEWKARSQLD